VSDLQGARDAQDAPFRIDRRERWAVAAILVLVVLTRLPTLGQPLVERHDWRQTQTAYTALIYSQSGVDLLHPQVPVLGPPYDLPFEFPL